MFFQDSSKLYKDQFPNLKLTCGNLRIAFFEFSFIGWFFTAWFLFENLKHYGNVEVKMNVLAINNFFSVNFPLVILLLLGPLVYFIFARKKLTWSNCLLIDGKSEMVLYYYFRELGTGGIFIHLQTENNLWILYSVTSQDNIRFKNASIAQNEINENRKQVKLLEKMLIASGATQKSYSFLSSNFFISLLLIIIVNAVSFLVLT